jgi:ABC-type uncharacterized transport system YnjBCD ATPase subunit
MSVLQACNLAKSYKSREILRDLSFTVTSGEVVGLLGPNGAGKTTAFYMIVGLTACEHGQILLDDRDIGRLPMHRRAQLGLGYLPQEPSVFRKLTVAQNIMAILETRRGMNGEEREARLEELLGELHIDHVQDSLGISLSGGERRRAPGRGRAPPPPRAALHPARRAVRRRRSAVRGRHPAHNQALVRQGHRRADHRPQRPRNPGHLRPGLHRQPGNGDRRRFCGADSCKRPGP